MTMTRGPQGVVALTTAVAVAAGAAGWVAATHVTSPTDAAAARTPPSAAPVTVPVQRRELTSQVVTQGSVTYGRATPITLTGTVASGSGEAGTQLVTKTATAGRTLRAGDVLLEINGRPVFVLEGEVPMYRTLTRGSRGDDVRQLRAALGLAAGGALNDTALTAVAALYDRAGYAAAQPTVEQRTQLRALERAVTDTEQAGGQPHRDALDDLAAYRETYGVSVPSGEVVFLPALPIRLTTVTAKPGSAPEGPVATVADPNLVVNATVATEDTELIRTGLPVTLQDSAGVTCAAKLTGIGAAYAVDADDDTAAPAGTPVRIVPGDAAKLTAGTTVKVLIQVGRTGGKVLVVPVAAVFTGADGQARVTVAGDDGATRDVPVTLGLTAGGEVQVTPVGAAVLTEGLRVVVGAT
ncbi:hypothetical protein [Actinoplanes sp. NPDC051851]|uniref:hypothetical protein n=1 Tax=Actinoplanes sp. NPDC051851 TaxID=3154753 RepID=UPI003433330F